MLIFSFDATPGCRSLEDCPTPGPSNELLAATAAAAYTASGGALTLHPQWEVAAAVGETVILLHPALPLVGV